MIDEMLMREMFDLLRAQQAQSAKMMESMMGAHAAQAQVFQSWLDMFKPTAQPLAGTSPDERVQLREAREAEAWEPMIPSMAHALLRGEDFTHG